MTEAKAPVRRRNAADSRRRLLDAARKLFAERGYERSTIRDIGEQAGLDSTLIARYFGSKAALYLEAMRTEFAAEEAEPLPDLLKPGRMAELIERVGRRGPGPILDVALQRLSDPTLDNQARTMLAERVVDPLDRTLSGDGADEARLCAEIITAAFIGVAVSRYRGALPALSAATPQHVAELLVAALGELDPEGSTAG
jgi:AcrR family transcriptional regulator